MAKKETAPKEKKSKSTAPEADVVETLEADAAEVTDAADTAQAEIDTLKTQNADYLDKMQRTIAEFDNFRKRTAKEKATMYDDGTRDAVLAILPAIDNFERALQSVTNTDDAFAKGVDMIYKQMMGLLDGLGVEAIDAVGKTFDPNLHSGVAHVEDEQFGENEIVEELMKGYTHKGKVIRYSMVKVAN